VELPAESLPFHTEHEPITDETVVPHWQSVLRLDVNGRVRYLSVSGEVIANLLRNRLEAIVPPEHLHLLGDEGRERVSLTLTLERTPGVT
jgi:hypothetical protein